ncbi:class F sortase [Actinomadura barringtoniae]|uniref:Class F sortase n=1 Tax=Actinomadura barringtoniae TaxID=1427535 RepID=A0A939PSM3_9ACTN|nr:class F sortase [Actinomadura barringtoniae]MBO2454036.1 class F sortase [Actinomadura barringtoniae]
MFVPVCLAGVAGCGGDGTGPVTSGPVPGWSAAPGQVAQASRQPVYARRGDPVRVEIPSIGVSSTLERLRMGQGGVLTPPRLPGRAGWFADGVRPGQPGPAVIVGHVDSRTGPAVFTRLGELRPGAVVTVRDSHGARVAFKVESVRAYPKVRFPTKEVYGATPDPQLRLITCGGGFDRATRHYTTNVVVYAGLVH